MKGHCCLPANILTAQTIMGGRKSAIGIGGSKAAIRGAHVHDSYRPDSAVWMSHRESRLETEAAVDVYKLARIVRGVLNHRADQFVVAYSEEPLCTGCKMPPASGLATPTLPARSVPPVA